jgi:hypothetical protein
MPKRFIPPSPKKGKQSWEQTTRVPKVPKVSTGNREVPTVPDKTKGKSSVGAKVLLYDRIQQLEAIKEDRGQLLEMLVNAEDSYGVNFFNVGILHRLNIPTRQMISHLATEELYKLILLISEAVVIRDAAEKGKVEYENIPLSDSLHLMTYIRPGDPTLPGTDGERPLYIKTFSLGCNTFDDMAGYLLLLNAAAEYGIKCAAPRINTRKSRTNYEFEIKGWCLDTKWREAKSYLEELAELDEKINPLPEQ